MKNKKRMYQGYNRKQLKEVASGLKKEVISITQQLEEAKKTTRVLHTDLKEEKARHQEYRELCVAYSSKNLDLKLGHDQAEQEWERERKKLTNELTATKSRNEKLVEQLEHFTKELLYTNEENTKLIIENDKLKQRGLIKRMFNRG